MPPDIEKDFELADSHDGVIDNDPLDNKSVDKEVSNKPEPKLSVREAIQKARDEQEEKSTPKKKDVSTPKEVSPAKATQNKEAGKKSEVHEAEEKTPPEVVDSTVVSKYEAPKGWTKEAKAEFERLPEVVKASIAKREEEASKGFKEYGDKVKQLDTYNNLVTTYVPDHQKYGLDAPKVVERTLQWLKVISNPDKSQAVNSLKELAKSFGLDVDLQNSYTPKEQSTTPASGQPGYVEPSSQNNSELQALREKVASLEGQFSSTAQQAATTYVNSWSKDKPHFEKVRGAMRGLIEANLVKLVDGKPDLDDAYDQACRRDPELYQQMLTDELSKKEQELLEAQKARDNKTAEHVQKAKRASVSLKPNAPMGTVPASAKSKNNVSVRDSIAAALKEVHGT